MLFVSISVNISSCRGFRKQHYNGNINNLCNLYIKVQRLDVSKYHRLDIRFNTKFTEPSNCDCCSFSILSTFIFWSCIICCNLNLSGPPWITVKKCNKVKIINIDELEIKNKGSSSDEKYCNKVAKLQIFGPNTFTVFIFMIYITR